MRINTIINRYMLKEFAPPFGISLFFFSFIFLITKILEITNLVVNYQVSITSFLLMLSYSMPFFLAFITPMSVMMAVLLTFLRMCGDNEITALKASGFNPNRFLIPVMVFCFMGWMLTTTITVNMMPWAKRSYFELGMDLAKKHADSVIKERTFINNFPGLTIYVNQVDLQQRNLKDVFIEDQRNKGITNIIVAPTGRIQSEPENQTIRLILFNGTINLGDPAQKTTNVISFDMKEMKLDLKEMMGNTIAESRPVEEMSLAEIKKYIRDTRSQGQVSSKALMKYHEKFALPFACFALGLVSIPLGMRSKRSNRSSGTIMGIMLFLGYYILLSVGWSLGESGKLPPVIGMWAPNIIVGSIGIYLYIRMVQEKPIGLGSS